MGLVSKIKTVLWYLSKPSYYGQLGTLVLNRIKNNPKENTRNEAEEWCEENSIEANQFTQLYFKKGTQNLKDIYPEVFREAEKRADEAPVKMGGPGAIDLIYTVCEEIEAKKILETGVAYGWSTLAILLSIEKRGAGQLISIDLPYAKMNNEDFVGCVVPGNLRNNWTLLREPDQKALPKAIHQLKEIDFCHYDSDKTYAGRKSSYPLIWQHIKKGGVFISDDIGDNIAFKEFCEEIGQTPYIIKLSNQFVGVLKK